LKKQAKLLDNHVTLFDCQAGLSAWCIKLLFL